MELDGIDQPYDIKEFMRKFAAHPRGMLLLSGMNGTGKSYACRAVLSDCPENISSMEFDEKVMINQAMLNIKWQEFTSKYGNSNYLLKSMFYPKLLILDDIGTRKPSDAFMDFLYVVVDYRYENREKCGTIVTTNLNAAAMLQNFGDAFVSRVAGGQVFRFEGKDRRINEF